MEEIVGLSLRSLVKKFNYKDMNYKDIKDWVATVWDLVIGYKPTFSIFRRIGMGLFSGGRKILHSLFKEHG